MHLVITVEPAEQLVDNALRILAEGSCGLIVLEGVNERLSHAIRLGTYHRGRARGQSNAPGVGTRRASGERWLGSSEQLDAIAKWSVRRFHAAARSGALK